MRQRGDELTTVKLTETLKNIPLFSVLTDKERAELSKSSQIFNFSAGENIPTGEDGAITVIISGSVAVMKNELLMRMLSQGSVSGVASLYGNEGAPVSVLRANTASTVASVNGDAVRSLIRQSPAFAESYIRFLTSRIRFLNRRIRAYTSGSAEAKLAFHILYSDDSETGTVDLGVSMSALADMLSIGRASLYRACDALVTRGAIRRKGNTVEIIDRDALNFFEKKQDI